MNLGNGLLKEREKIIIMILLTPPSSISSFPYRSSYVCLDGEEEVKRREKSGRTKITSNA